MAYKVSRIAMFKGLSQNLALTAGDPSFALDCVNVLPSVAGLAKLRIPFPLTPLIAGNTAGPDQSSGPDQFAMMETGVGATIAPGLTFSPKVIIGFFNKSIYIYSLDDFTPYWIDTNDNYQGPVPWSVVQSNETAFMQNGKSSPLKFNKDSFSLWGILPAVTPPTVGTPTTGDGNINLTVGRSYRIAYKNSKTGHVSTASKPSDSSGSVTNGTITITIPPPLLPDSQIDSARIYATLDGGADDFFVGEVNGPFPTTFTDTLQDIEIDQTERAPLINAVPPRAKFLARWGARIFMFNLVDESDKWVAYTGYNRIFVGRPEETCPQGNRIKCETGADEITGGGVIDAGVIVFDRTDKMWMFRGQPEDIVVTAPVEFTLFLKELPWPIGCSSHFTIVSTPYGLIWLSTSLSVWRYDGVSKPEPIDEGVQPILRSINKDQIRNARATYWQYADKDYYVLGIPIQGSTELNRILIFDMEPGDKNAGTFPLDVGPFQSLGVIEMMNAEQKLVIGQGGRLKELKVTSTTINGIANLSETGCNMLSINNILGAYWQSGYFGNDDPSTMKFFRFGRVMADQQSIRVKRRLIDNDVRNIETLEFRQVRPDGKISTNRKARRLSYELRFSDDDFCQNILELVDFSIPVSQT